MTRESRIQDLLIENFQPDHLEVENESDQHSGPPGRESHFKVILVSKKFADLSRIERHQLVYGLLQSELDSGLHALALKLYTPEQWGQNPSTQSPDCSSKRKL